MQRIYWKKSRTICLVALAIALYLLVRLRSCKHEASVLLKNVKAEDVWEFVADFSNMKYLNPTIIDFDIIADSGNYNHWQYSTEYSEHLSQWPYLSNNALAHFNVKPDPKKDVFYINSVHTTCLLAGYYCLESTSEFKFSGNHSNTVLCEESVEYQCPAVFSNFCSREVEFQRSSIMRNLKLHFKR